MKQTRNIGGCTIAYNKIHKQKLILSLGMLGIINDFAEFVPFGSNTNVITDAVSDFRSKNKFESAMINLYMITSHYCHFSWYFINH